MRSSKSISRREELPTQGSQPGSGLANAIVLTGSPGSPSDRWPTVSVALLAFVSQLQRHCVSSDRNGTIHTITVSFLLHYSCIVLAATTIKVQYIQSLCRFALLNGVFAALLALVSHYSCIVLAATTINVQYIQSLYECKVCLKPKTVSEWYFLSYSQTNLFLLLPKDFRWQ